MMNIMVRAASISVLVLGSVYCARASPKMAAPPTGVWVTEDGRARIRTEPCSPGDTRLCGFVVWLRKPNDDKGRPVTDRYNADTSMQARAILGHQVLLGLNANADREYEGKIYNSDDGKTYSATVRQESASELLIKGCLLIFCGQQTWKRTLDVLPGQIQEKTNSPGGPRLDSN